MIPSVVSRPAALSTNHRPPDPGGTRRAVLGRVLLPALAGAFPAAARRAYIVARVLAIESLSPDVKRIRLRMPGSYRFEPGQFALIGVPGRFVASWNAKYGTRHGEVARPYSFASSPSRLPEAEFLIQHAAPPRNLSVPPGVASTYIHTELRPGDRLEVSAALGSLGAPASGEEARPVVLVAGGTGVAPFVGLLDHWFRTGQGRPWRIYLFFGARRRRDLILDAQFRAWAARHPGFTYVPALSEPGPDDRWEGESGFISSVLDRRLAGLLDADVLVAGPPRMMQETVKIAEAKGVPRSRIRHDPIQVAP